MSDMAIVQTDELRNMSDDAVADQLNDLELELARERGKIAVGGFPDNAGRLKEIRRTIARIKTVMNERKEEQ